METTTLRHARILWEFLSSCREEKVSEAVVVCCSYDLRICDYACDYLQKTSRTDTIIFSGNTGRWTKHLWQIPEAEVFRNRALEKGVTEKQIIIENKATNLGENISFSKALLPDAKRVTFISKPNTLMRIWLTIPIHWPQITGFTASPRLTFPDDISNIIGLFGLISEMVGDIQRIQEYPQKGFQIPCDIPDKVIYSWRQLKGSGFVYNLMESNS